MKKFFKTLLIIAFLMLITTSCDEPLLEGEKTCKELKELCKKNDIKWVSCNAGTYTSGYYKRYKFAEHFVYLSDTEIWNKEANWNLAFNLELMIRYEIGYTTTADGKEEKSIKIWFVDKVAQLKGFE